MFWAGVRNCGKGKARSKEVKDYGEGPSRGRRLFGAEVGWEEELLTCSGEDHKDWGRRGPCGRSSEEVEPACGGGNMALWASGIQRRH